ncbi:MAG: 30S ribosomal protein S3 [Candidatus Nanoarchaeia archaeon]|jgi:small subunit ribosomal protein S3
MIERKFVAEKMRELEVEEYIAKEIGSDKYSFLQIKRTPLGEKITIYTSRPGFIVGKKGETIKKMTYVLKNKFKMENPQIEVAEFDNPNLDAKSMADFIAGSLERFGANRFKSVGYKVLQRIMDAGAMGAEIKISGRGVPSSRAKSWRFYAGYLKKSGDISESQVLKAITSANLKSGTVGVKVSIMPSTIQLPDKIIFTSTIEKKEETKEEAPKEDKLEEAKAEEAVEVLKEKKETREKQGFSGHQKSSRLLSEKKESKPKKPKSSERSEGRLGTPVTKAEKKKEDKKEEVKEEKKTEEKKE